ncbi:MAG: glutathione-regulated potassium-efflux system ancillary protein KefC [Halioglobus sp.]|jgi:glutathione-regulated potassium-efflux system ancillary protein KefC
MLDPLIILIALACGMASRALGLPALIGYLAAGFLLHALNIRGGEILTILSEMGITLLLFTVGLKLQPAELLKTQVWGTTVIHMAAMQLLFLLALYLLNLALPSLGLNLTSSMVIAFALTFSSTVFVIQIMQERGEMASRHAGLAIGILVVQDLAAVLFLAFSTGNIPHPSAMLLLLLWPLRGVVLKFLARTGHGELFTLFGLTLALGGAEIFDLVGIKGDLGALIIGALLAGHQKAKELSRNLLQLKDLFLVGFFLTIGLAGWPGAEIIAVAVFLGILALLKPLLYFPLLTQLHTPPRTALLSSAALTNYSEFGLIVVSVSAEAGWVDAQWTAALSLAIAVSFVISSPLNTKAHDLYRRWHPFLRSFESKKLRARPTNTSNASVIVLGMGNIGSNAYDTMAEQYGKFVLGVDDNDQKLEMHRQNRRRVVAADASDPDFWYRVNLKEVELIMVALTNHQENLRISKLLKGLGYRGRIAAVVRFAEEAEELQQLGISAFNLYAQAGAGFATHAAESLDQL